jgi:predicted ATPase
MLCERAGEVVTKKELLAHVWPETIVEEANLRVHVAALRKSLGDGRNDVRYISNVTGRGYCFVAAVARVTETQKDDAVQFPVSRAIKPRTALGQVIGREASIKALTLQLPLRRLVTLVGSGGIGKTTVALAVVERLNESYADGVFFVDLALLSDAALVPSGLATALGLGISSGNPLAGSVAYLQDKRILIVLDSCEHVIDGVTKMVEEVLQAAPGVTILATSREPLRAAGEWVHRLPPLEIPSNNASLGSAEAVRFSAVQLFVERVTASTDAFALSDAEVPVVVKICRRLDGIPLALELAAANVDLFGIRGLASRLEQNFSLLTRGRRTALPRHRTLDATLNWSYNILTPREQLLIRRLAVYAGGFPVEAIMAVAEDPSSSDVNVLDDLHSLVNKSLVNVDASAEVIYYRLLESTRAYALEKLAESGERPRVMRRFTEYLCELLDQSDKRRDALGREDWFATYARHLDNIRTALGWAASPEGDATLLSRLTVAAVPVWVSLSLMIECRDRIKRALAGQAKAPRRDISLDMKLNVSLGVALLYTSGATSESGEAMYRGLELATTQDDAEYRFRALWGLNAYHGTREEHREQWRLAREFHDLAESMRSATYSLIGDRLLGSVLHSMGDQKSASIHLERMISRYDTRARWSDVLRFLYDQKNSARVVLAWTQWLLGMPDQARQTAMLAVEDAESMDHALTRCYALADAAGAIAFLTGDLATLQESVSKLLATAARHGLSVYRAYGGCLEAALLVRRSSSAGQLRRLGEAMDALGAMNFLLRRSMFFGVRAEGSLAIGQLGDAQALLDEAIAECESSESGWYLAELHRIKGEFVLKEGGNNAGNAAERLFLQAFELTEKQGALSWGLRTAISLAAHWHRSGRRQDALDFLSPVYGRFTEGFETQDLKTAQKLLNDLSGDLNPAFNPSLS